MHVFISHVDEEVSLATLLKEWIESAFLGQVQVFVSRHDIGSGEQWYPRLESELSAAKVMLVLCSNESVSMPWINLETGAGLANQIPIIPICHSGMDVEALPKPLQFFQGLVAEDASFSVRLMKGLAQHLGYDREPRPPHEQLSAELKRSLSELQQHFRQSDPDDEGGYLDHLAAFDDDMGELVELMELLGSETNSISDESDEFNEQVTLATANQTQGTPRHLQRIARRYGTRLDAYAGKLESLNERYSELLPNLDSSSRQMLGFVSPETTEDRDSVEELLSTLDTTESNVAGLRNSVYAVGGFLSQLPNFQKDLRRAVRKTVDQYDILIENLDHNLDVFGRIKASVRALLERRPN